MTKTTMIFFPLGWTDIRFCLFLFLTFSLVKKDDGEVSYFTGVCTCLFGTLAGKHRDVSHSITGVMASSKTNWLHTNTGFMFD